eukprot:TRINITY_DN1957_c0_g1_i3.p1 TRINITY_DN1957_c0_g1~~TRINITY_DN1957_c0_g1_i3.p1  ORF type:complete len:793 (-),score=171.08 TRINITY_DN1957_c0_g1_i3:3556-5889(-)
MRGLHCHRFQLLALLVALFVAPCRMVAAPSPRVPSSEAAAQSDLNIRGASHPAAIPSHSDGTASPSDATTPFEESALPRIDEHEGADEEGAVVIGKRARTLATCYGSSKHGTAMIELAMLRRGCRFEYAALTEVTKRLSEVVRQHPSMQYMVWTRDRILEEISVYRRPALAPSTSTIHYRTRLTPFPPRRAWLYGDAYYRNGITLQWPFLNTKIGLALLANEDYRNEWPEAHDTQQKSSRLLGSVAVMPPQVEREVRADREHLGSMHDVVPRTYVLMSKADVAAFEADFARTQEHAQWCRAQGDAYRPVPFWLESSPTTGCAYEQELVQRYEHVEGILPPQPRIDRGGNLWVVKPGSDGRGNGVGVISSLDDPHYRHARDGGGRWVVQKYVEHPLLWRGQFKNHMRVGVLVTSLDPLTAFAADAIVMRPTGAPYTGNDVNPFRHITNTQVQEKLHLEGSLRNPFINFHDLWRVIAEREFGDHAPAEMLEHVVPRIRELAARVVRMIPASMHLDTLFEELAVDVALDETFQPWLIEVNDCAAFLTSRDMEETAQFHETLLDVVLDEGKAWRKLPPSAEVDLRVRHSLIDRHVWRAEAAAGRATPCDRVNGTGGEALGGLEHEMAEEKGQRLDEAGNGAAREEKGEARGGESVGGSGDGEHGAGACFAEAEEEARAQGRTYGRDKMAWHLIAREGPRRSEEHRAWGEAVARSVVASGISLDRHQERENFQRVGVKPKEGVGHFDFDKYNQDLKEEMLQDAKKEVGERQEADLLDGQDIL